MTDVRIITEPLGGSALSRLLQSGAASAHWLCTPPRDAAGWRAYADSRRAEEGWTARWALLAPALQASGAAAERLARVQREGGVVVTTGQQPGLFGGPIYTWSKAVSAIALADALEQATGIPTAPVFWAATDDADFAEASSTVVARTGGMDVLREREAPPAGTPMALAPLGDLTDALRGLRGACGSAADPRALEAALTAYGDQSRTVGDAFVMLLRELLAPLGMAVLDASHPAVLRASEPTVRAALQAAPAIERALAARSAELRSAGQQPQVEDMPGFSLVFSRMGTTKRRLPVGEAVSAGSGTFSPNVLLRPIVERAILPTVAYVAGPGELAYFAQVTAVADALGLTPPVAVPRWSATLLEPQIRMLLSQYGLKPAEVAAQDVLEARLAREAMSAETSAVLQSMRSMIAALPETLKTEADELKIGGAVQGGAMALQHRMDRLERRILAAVKRREGGRMRDVGTLRAALYPGGVRQERALNLVPLLARHGLELLTEMRQAASEHAVSLVDPLRGAPAGGASS
jgi:uncharacterized protein YllA (UPF0747 family)